MIRTRTIAVLFSLTALLTQLSMAQQPPVTEAPVPEPVATAPAVTPAAVNPTQPAVQKGQMEVPGQPGVLEDKHAFGVLPNYRTAESSVPYSPITVKQKFRIATADTIDGPSFVLAAFFSSISQLDGSEPSFHQGVVGYLHRYGTNLADQDIGNFMTESIMTSLLHQDPRYFRKGTGSVKSRILWAASRSLIARNNSGNWTFNAAEFLGNGVTASIGNLYYPDDRGFGPTMQRMFTQIGTDTVSQVLKEFWPDVKKKFLHKNDGNIPVAGALK
jgi:hypothetical protein